VPARAAAALAVALAAAACSTPAPEGASPTDPTAFEPMPSTTGDPPGCSIDGSEPDERLPAGVEPGAAPTLPPGVDTGYTGSGGGSGNPYLVPGARPVPGPDMPVTSIGPVPVTDVVVAPPNPDVGSPAATPEGETTVPAPPTTFPESPPPAPPAGGGTTTTALMALAEDPGCVATAGQP
jgi:hypothetical protein